MFAIETFTAQPDLVEDRIRLDAIDSVGACESIFLTRRLADRFVPLLVERIEAHAQPGVPKAIGLAMNQQQLRLERRENPLPDVTPSAETPRWLCRTIHLAERGGDLEWTLTDDAQNTAAMPLAGPGGRAVLDIFLLMYRRLEWGLEVFPAWLCEDEAEAAPEKRTLN